MEISTCRVISALAAGLRTFFEIPDDSSLHALAGFTRAFSIASLHHFLSSFCLCSLPLRFSPSPSSLRILVDYVTGVLLVKRMVLRSSGLAASNRQPLVWFYWVDTCAPVGRLVGGALVRVARAHGCDSGTLCLDTGTCWPKAF